jgi:hypothetical protein
MTQIGQDTETVHLLDDDEQPLCEAKAYTYGVNATAWAAGFTPAGLGVRICRDCETKAGTAAVFEPGEREAEHPTMPELADAEDMGK